MSFTKFYNTVINSFVCRTTLRQKPFNYGHPVYKMMHQMDHVKIKYIIPLDVLAS